MRKTAYKLCERLRRETEFCQRLNPAFFVGHGQGSDGMAWRGEQEEILKKFRSGDVKLLVSTSVLEEGLDVPACNQIIRFDSSLTLRAIVQGGGRAARRPNSQFVIICSDASEETLAREAIRKEANMEKAMQDLNVNTCDLLQASSFDCQVKKPDFSKNQGQESNGDSMEFQPADEEHDMGNDFSVETLTVNERGESLASGGPTKRRKNYVPRIAIIVHNVVFGDESKELDLLTDYFNEFVAKCIKTGESKEMTKTTDETSDRKHTSRCVRLELEPSKQGQFNNKDKFFGYVAQCWCSRPREILTQTKQLWLRRDDISQKDKDYKPVMVIKPDIMSLGYFRSESQYCQHWPFNNSKLENIRIAFQHDLKTVLICFTVPNPRSQFKADLYKLHFHYNELQEYILVNRPRSSDTYLYLLLRHPPRMFKAKSFAKKDQDVDDDNNDFEDWYYGENDSDSGCDHENIDEFTSDSEDSEAVADGVYSTADHSKKGETPDNESLLTSTDIVSIDDVVNWERVVEIEDSRDSFGSCCTYNFTFKPDEWNDMKDVLATIAKYDKKVFYASVTNSLTSLPEISIPNGLPFDVKYATQCVLHSYPFIRGRITGKFNHLLSSKPEKVVRLALARLGSAIERNSFCDPEEYFESLLEEKNVAGTSGISKQLLPSECAMIKRMVVTPTRLLFFPPEVMSKNRVLRNFDTDQFLCANVRDEDFSRLSSASGIIDKILERLQTTLDNGVMAGGQRFLYLGSSNSQLRNHGCWFVRPRPYPEEIREWMGDFSTIRCVGGFMACVGQCFSTSMDAVAIDVNEGTSWKMDEDIKTSDASYCFSDGVGRISQPLAQQVAETIALDFTPSAIQIRFAGFKGVLALDPTLSGKTAVFRPSMRKFESPHRRLEVLQTSRPQPVFLNHQLIILLSSLGIPDEVFMNLQRRMLDRLAGMLVDEKLATLQLVSGAKTDIAYKRLSEAGLQLTSEPFFKSLLVALYKEQMQNLLKRARILLPTSEARLMIGVMDETGILKPGQVFVQYSLVSNEADRFMEFSKSSSQILTGPVVVTRNPCLHPGDVRQLTAVSVPQLAHFVDCIVFPNHGPRPHPSEMAGGDLDGDMYFVCWMKDLLPKKPLFPPMNYIALPQKEVNEPITVSHMTKFVAEYIRYDQLGVIDNAHKAQADSQEAGVESQLCLDLAERHSRAVDAPKTGVWPEMPREAKVTVFPDFMMKSDKPSYSSNKVLGKLYRECRSFKNSIARDILQEKPYVDPGFLIPGYQQYQEEARESYEDFSNQLQAIMNLYGIETEGELMSGCFSKFHSSIGREKIEIVQIISRFLRKMRENFREKFFEEFDDMVDDDDITLEMQQKASAWYYVAYSSRTANNTAENTPEDPPQTQFLSFPWLMDDVILRITLVRESEVQESGGLVSSISESVFDEFEKERDTLLRDFQDRIHKKNFIRKAMPEVKALAMFGSSATFLFRKHSDLDLCCLSDDDRVSFVPYYGNHHSTHDSLALYVPLLSNQRTDLQRIGEDYTRHEFLCFQEKFLIQAQDPAILI
ncbi:PREDICTED: RNA-dependent RNA polymerase 1-like [Acropora digitifera]|uniref:RNA-dependent RNA polymerase 1-like n=1 Tax=Acropora digitifera TaxID=70779 RepID=UPI00077AC7E5|nr:PREDICTED: RNA-dependent RNA polymerase 1-like [Acropora digitifera]